MDNFEKWFNKVNEKLAESPTVDTEVTDVIVADVDSNRSNMIGDIDTIMTSLETLAGELKEELAIDLEVNEAAADFIKSWITGIKAAKAQQKVNKIKMNASDLEFAADKFEGDKKKSIIAKSEKVKEQAKELQDMVNDRFSGKGSYVDGRLHKEKIKGQLEIIKRTSGMEDNPNKKSDMVTKMKELSKKYAEEKAAIAELEDENKEVIAAAKEKSKEAINKPKDTKTKDTEPKETKTDKELADEAAAKKAAEDATKEPAKEEEPAKKTEEDKVAEIEADIKTINTNIEDSRKEIESKTKELEQAERDVKVGKGSDEKIQQIKKAIEDEKEDVAELKGKEKSLKAELGKMTAKESLIYRATEASLLELATEISEKADWQLDKTVLYTKYDTIIKKAGYDSIITESTSIKDKFNTLLNS